jgi:hypothetical protein
MPAGRLGAARAAAQKPEDLFYKSNSSESASRLRVRRLDSEADLRQGLFFFEAGLAQR